MPWARTMVPRTKITVPRVRIVALQAGLEILTGNLRVGIGGLGGDEVKKSFRESVVGQCVGVVRSCVVVGSGKYDDVDARYRSMSDEACL